MIMRKHSPFFKIINHSLIDLPAPVNISFWWNTGSLAGVCLSAQIITGLFLAMHYSNDMTTSFSSLVHILKDVNNGWIIQALHANGASMFFICLYSHVGRGMYYSSFLLTNTWNIGVILLLLAMATAFMRYVLPWGQMSFWGATVITNLLSAIPYLGTSIVQWVWGGFAMGSATLTRFFMVHFILPFIILSLVLIHLLFLHQSGSNNPLGVNPNLHKIPFHPFFSIKDLLGMTMMIMLLIMLCFTTPYLLTDVENFIPANPLVTPTHIQPEWYFLFAYAILRSIPNKLGGVLCLVFSIIILLTLPLSGFKNMTSKKNSTINQFMFWAFTTSVMTLTWIGACPVEPPFIVTGQMISITYFSYFIIDPMITSMTNKSTL